MEVELIALWIAENADDHWKVLKAPHIKPQLALANCGFF
jgi:hypothetical protein